LIDEVDQIFVFFSSIQHAKTTLFLKACLFFPWLAGRFHNFELTQNRGKKKQEMAPYFTISHLIWGMA
jgi:hypothetical protein